MSEHPVPERIARLVGGGLESEEADLLLAHLAECDACLDLADRLRGSELAPSASPEVPELDAAAADRLEMAIFRRIQLAGMGTQVSVLITTGFLGVVLTLLRPFLAAARPVDSRREVTDD